MKKSRVARSAEYGVCSNIDILCLIQHCLKDDDICMKVNRQAKHQSF